MHSSFYNLHKDPPEVLSKGLIQLTSIKLRTYIVEDMPVVGEIAVDVTYQGKIYALTLYVVQVIQPSLLVRSWLQHIWLD